MASWISSIHKKLLKPTDFFGIKLWVAITVCIGSAIVLAFCCCLIFRRRRSRRSENQHFSTKHMISAKPMQVSPMMNKRLLSRNGWDIELAVDHNSTPGKKGVMTHSSNYGQSDKAAGNNAAAAAIAATDMKAVGKEYTLNEMELATNWFADENVMGSGDYGVVYRGVLLDHTRVAVKKLLVNRARLKDLATEVDSLCCMKHKNLVKLLGYCTEGMFSFLVYEYVDNGTLNHWLHESIFKPSPLSWKIRIGIIQGVAKGLAYLHEDSEIAVPHQHLKSSNILLDKQWNPKIIDFGISKLLIHDKTGFLVPPVGMSGYLAPEYGNTFTLNVKNDVYSFGVLVMEIVSGRTAVEYTLSEIEEYLVDWMKYTVSEGNLEEILDPSLPAMPSLVELKRIVLIALRCVDPDASSRPNMGDVVHMLEPRDLLLTDEVVVKRAIPRPM